MILSPSSSGKADRMPADTSDLLDRVRKLLAKAEGEGVTPHEAEALTVKAAELMARYGIDRAILGHLQPGTDNPIDRVFTIDKPWADVKAYLLSHLATTLRCEVIEIDAPRGSRRLHVFGYASDIDRASILYSSLLVQMSRALAAQPVPAGATSVRAWRRSWMLGFAAAAGARVREAEERAAGDADNDRSPGPSTTVILADRAGLVRRLADDAYPVTRPTRVTYAHDGYADGYAQGQHADIGNATVQSQATAIAGT